MVRLPWRSKETDEKRDASSADPPADAIGDTPLVTCQFQDGTLFVFETAVYIERSRGSKFEDKQIAITDVRGVEHSEGFVIGYLQIEQVDFVNDQGGIVSSPVDENTLHFGHGKRSCARRARDEILARVE